MKAPEPESEYLTTREVAALCRVDPRTVSLWIRKGHLMAIRPTGGKYLIPKDQPAILAIKESSELTNGDS